MLNAKAQHETKNDQSQPDGTVTNFVGSFNYGNESIQPKWRATFNVDYMLKAWRLHWDTAYIGGTENLVGVNHVLGGFIPDYWYHNLSASYDLAELISKRTTVFERAQIILGVSNLMDKDPPSLGADSICKCNSFAGPYDFTGRFLYTRLSFKF